MKRITLLVLAAAATVDVCQQAYNSDLLDAIAARMPNQSALDVVAQSPVMTTIEHWALFILGFAFLSLVMAMRKDGDGPGVIR